MNGSNQATHETDVLIIGHSMAGGCLARQLHIAHPDLNITVLERKTEFGYWVGESTLEAFWSYASRSLNLGHYLDTNHLYKHGLRFFYDSEDKNLSVSDMSEVGRSWYHGTPAHQLDRKKFDTDLCRMNVDSGIDVRMGVTVTDVDLDAVSGHLIKSSQGDFKARWVVDAAGFASPLGRKLDLIESNDENHPISAYWARISGVSDLDLLGDADWRERTRYTTRTLATTHFMYGGYWMWLIPLDSDTYSIGLITRNDQVDISIKGQEEFLSFLRSHRCMRELLPECNIEVHDYMQMKKLSRRAKTAFSKDRWFLTGMSAVFLDPLLSPGSAFLSDSNRMIGEMIRADLEGRDADYASMVMVFNRFSQFWLDNFFLHIKGLYHNCYERQKVYFTSMLMQWFGIILPSSMTQNWGYHEGMGAEEIEQFNAQMDYMTENNVIHRIDAIAHQFEDILKERGSHMKNNRGQFFDVEIDDRFMENTRTMGRSLTFKSIMEIEHCMLEVTYEGILSCLLEHDGYMVDCSLLKEVSIDAASRNLTVSEAYDALKVVLEESKVSLETSTSMA